MSAAMKTVCVTGGAGFIGSHLVRKLLGLGCSVRVIDNLSVGLRENVPPQADFIEGDIADPAVAAAAAQCEVLIHLAARVAIRSSFEFIVEDANTNVVGTASLLRAASSEAAHTRKFLFASSMAVYGESQAGSKVSEQHTIAPLSPYGVSKYAGEMLVRQVCAASHIDAGILRLFNTYGRGQRLSPYVGVATIFANAMRQGKAPTIFGDGEQCRDFVHVEDVAQAFVQAMHSDCEGEVFNIGSGRGYTVNTVYRAIARALDFSLPPRYADAVPGELRYSVADIGKAAGRLAYRPEHEFSESIAAVVKAQQEEA